ncbi:MAG: DUF2723 domain-containing protein, partial [Acidobacteria bacterium]|nr:DUF2723 domain-containing protein [Acidobacteriota bacterium]
MPTVPGSALGALKSPYPLAALISLCALVFYTSTLLPSVDWAEGARSQLRAYLAQADSTAGGHPVYFYLGHLFVRLGVGDPAWRINLSSAIYGAVAIFFFALTAFEITGMLAGQDRPGNPGPSLALSLSPSPPFSLSAWPVALASVTLGVSHVFWFASTHPRPFSMNMVVLTAAVFLTVRWIRQPRIRLFAALSFVLGLSVGVHVFTAALTPVFAATLAARWRQQGLALSRKGASGVAACYLAGLSPYLFVLLRDLSRIKQPFAVAALALGAPLGGPALEGWSQALWRTAQESLMTLAYSFF